jgi:hypothetical protein
VAIGFRRQRQNHLGSVDGGIETRLACARPRPHRAVDAAQMSTSWPVFQLMPLPPLPSLSSSGPIEVNFL